MAGPVEIATCALFDSMQPQLRVSPEDGTFLRDVACGFGSSPGTYRFLLSAVGYVPKPILSLPSIARFYGGCPSSNDGGTHFTLPQCPSDLQTNRRSSWRWRYDTLRHSLRSCPLGDPIGSTAAVNAIR
jgi:hypothetical protein